MGEIVPKFPDVKIRLGDLRPERAVFGMMMSLRHQFVLLDKLQQYYDLVYEATQTRTLEDLARVLNEWVTVEDYDDEIGKHQVSGGHVSGGHGRSGFRRRH